MATLVYAPAIKVHIATEKHGILDVSEDIANWELVRRSNAVSSFNFVLQNPQRKYDRVFKPSDRISVQLKRITWMRVFTGSLNNVPIFSAWPRALPMSASCSLKKLQFWPWDPQTTDSFNMIQKFISGLNSSSADGDAGLSKLIVTSMNQVTDWDRKAIHIGAVPNAWFKWAQKTEQEITAAADMSAVLGPATIGGTTLYGDLHLKPGHWGTGNFTKDQLDNAGQIYAITVGPEVGLETVALQDRAATLALMVALDESSLINLSGGDRDSVGLFQQRAGYGTVEQRMNIRFATLAFLKGTPATGADGTTKGAMYSGLLDYNWKTGNNLGLICQHVQRSIDSSGSNYAQMQPTAEALVKAFRKLVDAQMKSGPGAGTTPTDPTGLTETGKGYRASGDQVAKVAYDLVADRKPGTIWYSQTQASDPTSQNPRYLDCSQLDRWVLYHATGKVWPARDTKAQWASLKIKDVPFDIAAHIRGCLMYGSGSGNGQFSGEPDHTGVSLGNNYQHIAAHCVTAGHLHDVDQEDLHGSGLWIGALAPGIDYTRAATNEAARAWLQNKLGKKCFLSSYPNLQSVGDPSKTNATGNTAGGDPFEQLITLGTSSAQTYGDIFGGTRELINNQYFLPWLANVTHSSMRAFCSAPNGDFIAWFPDYFNVWKTAAIMDIKLIELQDFTVEWSDQQIVTHEFVLGTLLGLFNNVSGQIVDGSQNYSTLQSMLVTEGIATMDFPQIFKTIYGKPASSKFVTDYLQRFGARPNVEQFPNILHGPQEFYMALWMFMKHWAEQFNATVPMTFMPEIWPGMIMRIQEYGFQAYVTEVTHRGSYGQDGQFTTEAKIIAPAPIDEKVRASLFGMLDVFGNG